MQVETRAGRMKHAGITREEMKEAVKDRLSIGKSYPMPSGRDNEHEQSRDKRTNCKLLYFSRNAAVFESRDGSTETFTYQELWTMLVTGKIA